MSGDPDTLSKRQTTLSKQVNMPVVVFDLDDTLYDTLTYLHGGLKEVSAFLAPILSIDKKSVFLELKDLAAVSHEKVFDRFLLEKGGHTKKLVKRCITIYRTHTPHIQLYPEAKRCLEHLSKYFPLYIVTDGNKLVQMRKLAALHVEKWIKKAFCTHHYGLKSAKPSTYCFTKIASLEKVKPKELIYIGDNPKKDFVALKKAGFCTLRVRTGQHKDVYIDEAHEALHQIPNLSQLDAELILRLVVRNVS